MRAIRSSLTLQLALLAVVPAILATAAMVLVMASQHLRDVRELSQANARNAARQLAQWAQGPMTEMDRRAVARGPFRGVADPDPAGAHLVLGRRIAGGGIQRHRTGPPGLQVTAPIGLTEPRGQVVIDFSLAEVRAAAHRAWLNVLLALAACLAGVVLVGTWAARRISAPVRELATAVDQLGAGQAARVRQQGTAEIRRLQEGFNRAAAALLDSRRTLESRVRQATTELEQKNRQIELVSQAKTRLLAAASHDLRQPLHALTLFSESLATGETDPARLQRIKYVRECVESLDHLFLELLNISQIDAGVLKPQRSDFALDRLFDDISRNFRPVAEAQELRLVVRRTDLWVNCDYYMLSRIVGNLVSNALRHTTAGGVLVAARRRGTQVSIEVVDTGVGIAPEHQQRIFEEFYRVDNRPDGRTCGMGLGLATVQRLAGLLKAGVTLRSTPGRGTSVRVSIAAATPHREAAPIFAPEAIGMPASDSLAGLCVLVVDDEPTILAALRLVFSGWGASVLCARDGAEALELASRWRAPPDVVVIDLRLRNGEHGMNALTALRQHPHGIGPRTAQIFVTGDTEIDAVRCSRESGIPVFHKPLTPTELRRAIQQQLAAARSNRPRAPVATIAPRAPVVEALA
ncbi:hybrid sensor histidine kinase/response regulator [Ottowia sp.]|uniref:ATP-binding response regulator n=1 Tax=Ottowia sp. TaxID=1898956 RepID=UPI002B8BA23E|nr:hybrid sensor histidine kinase/response regulator [Ottowia sp.]HRN75447.1 hybrid sensor histidine kinase/response regulator [Ottowia sp.]HRQ03016.1 hybrid sensor histidine kinase/response regulator [Ottowia sp.]